MNGIRSVTLEISVWKKRRRRRRKYSGKT